MEAKRIQDVGRGGEPMKLLETASFTIIQLLIIPKRKHKNPTTSIVIPMIRIGMLISGPYHHLQNTAIKTIEIESRTNPTITIHVPFLSVTY